MILRILPFLALATVASLHAAPPPLPPTDITSDEFTSNSTPKETTTFFTGNVVVTGNNVKITCDKLMVISLPQANKGAAISHDPQKFKYLLATGHVHIFQGQREAVSGRADVYPAEEKMVLTMDPVVTDHTNGSVYTGDRLVLLHREGTVTGTHVHITSPPIKDMGFGKSLPAASP